MPRGAPIGNQNWKGPSRGRPWTEAIDRALKQAVKEPKKGRATLNRLAEKLIGMADAGDLAAMREIADRLEGRPVQAITAQVDTSVTVEIVRLADSAS